MKKIIRLLYTVALCFAVLYVTSGCGDNKEIDTGIIFSDEFAYITDSEKDISDIFDTAPVTEKPSDNINVSTEISNPDIAVSPESNLDRTDVAEIENVVITDNNHAYDADFENDSNISSFDDNSVTYILNTNTYKFHYESCGSAKQIKQSNKDTATDRDSIIARGFSPCKRCNP